MGMIAKTLTRGFRTSYFRNQPVHQFYGHLQAVLKDIDPSGEMDNLFARPETPGSAGGIGQEVEWSTDLPGDPISFKDLPAEKQQEVAGLLSAYIDKIRKYSESKQGKTGVEKDYAEYLRAVAMSPDLNQVFVVNRKPVLVHWGFICDSDNHPGQGIYAGWDEFIAQVQRKAAKQPEPEAKPVIPTPPPEAPKPQPVPQKEPEKKPEQAAAAAAIFSEKPAEKCETKKTEKTEKPKEVVPAKKDKPAEKKKDKPVLACGLGGYKWVKWLAIVLAIIILLLLLLRLLPPRNPLAGMSGMPGMSSGGGNGSLEDLLGQLGTKGGGGMPSLGGGNGSGGKGNGGNSQGTCPHCGHSIGGQQSGTGAKTQTPKKPADKQPTAQQPKESAPAPAPTPAPETTQPAPAPSPAVPESH